MCSPSAARVMMPDYRLAVSTDAPNKKRVRAAEVLGGLCLATDLGMGFPFEHGLQTTLIAMRLAERLGADSQNDVRGVLRELARPFRVHDRGVGRGRGVRWLSDDPTRGR
jgi:hypothetical protein